MGASSAGAASAAAAEPNDAVTSAGAPAPTSTICRRSPNCGWRRTTSRVPIGTVTSASGSAPMCSPSTHTSVPADATYPQHARGQADGMRQHLAGVERQRQLAAVVEAAAHQLEPVPSRRHQELAVVGRADALALEEDVERNAREHREHRRCRRTRRGRRGRSRGAVPRRVPPGAAAGVPARRAAWLSSALRTGSFAAAALAGLRPWPGDRPCAWPPAGRASRRRR